MKRLCVLLLFLSSFYLTNAQDTIITQQGDTIDCKITRVADQFIHFSVFDKSGTLLLRSRLPLSQVVSYTQAEVSQEDSIPTNEEEESTVDFESYADEFAPAKIRLAANGGFSYQFGGYEGLPQSYRNQVQTLWNFGGELHYFLIDELGIGVKYNRITTNAEEEFVPFICSSFCFSDLTDEKIAFNYLGFSVVYRNILYDDQIIYYHVSGGNVNYRTDGVGDGIPFFQSGDTFGFTFGVGYDYVLAKNFGVGVGLEVTIARLSELNDNGTNVPADFDISRLDLSIGIRFLK